MLSIRNISRSAVRSASRLSAQPATRRSLSTLYRPSFATLSQQTPRLASLLPQRAAFSTTLPARQTQEGQVDGELSAKLQEEYNMEQEMGPSETTLPTHLQDFLDSSGFTVSESAGSEEITLTKTFGPETIRVTFSTADLDAFDPDADPYANEDGALADEGADPAAAPASKSNAAAAPAEEAEDAAEEEEPSFPARVDVTIEKPGAQGAVQFAATASDGQFLIDKVFYLPNKALADPKDAQADWSRRGLYTGPPYGNLDEDLQVLMEKYLEERGVNTALALWVPEYIDFKEQREYLQWLQSLKNFVDA